MAAMQGSMADLSSANSTYLSTVEEPELSSINFRQSLRFFQEQLINSKGFPSSSASRSDVRKFCIDFENEHNRNEIPLNEVPKSLTNSRISIPTVDTILESVRVLRAIQKSQQQRGSTWSLNLLQSDDELEIQQSSIFEDLKNADQSDSIFKNGFQYFLPSSVDSKPIEKYLDESKSNFPIENEEVYNKTPEFWPSNNIAKHDFSIDLKKPDEKKLDKPKQNHTLDKEGFQNKTSDFWPSNNLVRQDISIDLNNQNEKRLDTPKQNYPLDQEGSISKTSEFWPSSNVARKEISIDLNKPIEKMLDIPIQNYPLEKEGSLNKTPEFLPSNYVARQDISIDLNKPNEKMLDTPKQNYTLDKVGSINTSSKFWPSNNIATQDISLGLNINVTPELRKNIAFQTDDKHLNTEVDIENNIDQITGSIVEEKPCVCDCDKNNSYENSESTITNTYNSDPRKEIQNEKTLLQNCNTKHSVEVIETSNSELNLTISNEAETRQTIFKEEKMTNNQEWELDKNVNRNNDNIEYFNAMESQTFQTDEPILPSIASDQEGIQNISDSLLTNCKQLRPESRSDTCSSIYASAEGSPCSFLYNDLESSTPIQDRIQAYTSQCESKDSAFETWTTESSGISTDLTNDSRSNESTSSRSSTSNDNILDDCCIVSEATTKVWLPLTSSEDSRNNVEDSNIIDTVPILNETLENNSSSNPNAENKINKLEEYSACSSDLIVKESKQLEECLASSNDLNINENSKLEECSVDSSDSNINGSKKLEECSADGDLNLKENKKLEECSADSSDLNINESKKLEECSADSSDLNINESKKLEKCSAGSSDLNINESKKLEECSADSSDLNINESKKLEECSADSSDLNINGSKKLEECSADGDLNLKENKKLEECSADSSDLNVNESKQLEECSADSSGLNINESKKLEECSADSSDLNINESKKLEDCSADSSDLNLNESKMLEGNITNNSDSNINDSKINGAYVEKLFGVNQTLKLKETDDDTFDIHSKKKFTTSSWNLEAITESLYALEQAIPSKIFPEDSIFQGTILVMSKGAFCKYPEGIYTLVLQQRTLQILQETNRLIGIPLTYAEVSEQPGNIVKVDNKLGKCLYFKSETQDELKQLKEELELHSSKCWGSERINLVHYPLKCHQNVVIIDLGSCSTRAGILMDQPTLPFLFFPSICAVNKKTGNPVYGKEALQLEVRQNSNLSFPLRPSIKIVKHSIDVDLIGGLFKKIFHDLRVDPVTYTVQVCLPRSLSIAVQNALVKLLLEDIKVRSVSLTHQALLTLYAHNVSTGIVVDVGDRMDILPVVDGFIVESGVTRLPYGGQRLIHHMKHALAEKQISLSNDIESFVVQYISENLCYVAEDYAAEEKLAMQHPDVVKKTITLATFTKDDKCAQYATLDEARFKTPEGLFKPELWGLDFPGIHKLVQKAIQATGVDVRKKIADNIYVSGGVTLIPGFVERLTKEVSILNQPRIIPKVIASNYRYHCTYIGACEFARMEVFPKVCVNIEEYSKNQISSLKKFVLCF